jgi:hypothetical protein
MSMPPCNYQDYPQNWKTEIRPAILKRANNCCEECGIRNYSVGYRSVDQKFVECQEWLYNESKFTPDGHKVIKIILTIAHLDHDTTNNDPSNLKALCQLHHLKHDTLHHKKNTKETIRKKKGLQSLF